MKKEAFSWFDCLLPNLEVEDEARPVGALGVLLQDLDILTKVGDALYGELLSDYKSWTTRSHERRGRGLHAIDIEHCSGQLTEQVT